MMRKIEIADNRNYGIDLLRIISMCMVIVLHINYHGGILDNLIPNSINYKVVWFFEIASYGAVNCFALISGYVGVNSKQKYSSIVVLWIRVFVYSVVLYLIMVNNHPEAKDISHIWESIFPVIHSQYWYFTAYVIVFIFSPIVYFFIHNEEKRQVQIFLVVGFALFSVCQIIMQQDIFWTNYGYSSLWLIYLYALGGYIAKYGFIEKMSAWLCFVGFWLMIVLSWVEKMYKDGKGAPSWLVSYISPTIVSAAVLILLWCLRIRLFKVIKCLIAFFALLSFSVYLIHEHPFVRMYAIKDRFAKCVNWNLLHLLIYVIGSVAAIFVFCSLIDFFREQFFKVLKIQKIVSKFIDKVEATNVKQ